MRTQYNLNVRKSRKGRQNLCFRQGNKPFFVICDKGPWKLNNEEETRNYFESIRGRKVTESTQEITDVNYTSGNLEDRLF